jgi:cytochrome b6-f complex iron-sulfur subunit
VPAAKNLVDGTSQEVADPGADVDENLALADRSVLAFWRKCPHLGCQIPQLCDASHWFECLCHGSKYTVLGEKRDGPAPRGMDRFPVSVENGAYVVNTGEKIDGTPVGTVTFDTRKPTDMPHCIG